MRGKITKEKILRENKKVIEEMEKENPIDPKKTTQQIISGQLADRIKRQSEYRKVWMTRLYVQTEIEEMARQLTGTAQITMQWYGQPFPKKLLGIEHDLKFIQYGEIVAQENYLKQALKRDGLTEEELILVLKGEFKKHQEMLRDSQKKEREELEDKNKNGKE
jgi:hypothetical protein